MEQELRLVLKVDRYRQAHGLTIFQACSRLGISSHAYETAKAKYLGKLIPRYQHHKTVSVEDILKKRNLNFDDMGEL